MARKAEIISTKDTFRLTVDGNEIEGVKEYTIHEDCTREKVLTVSIAITDSMNLVAKD